MITKRDLQILDWFAEEKANAARALGRQSKDSVGYPDCVKQYHRRNAAYTRFLLRLKKKVS